MNLEERRVECANHGAAKAIAYCRGCRLAFCDTCCVFAINDDVWCEACGRGVEEDTRPRYARAALVLVLGFVIMTAIWLAKLVFVPIRIPYFIYVMLLGYGASLSAAWRALNPTTGDSPTIERRRAGAPLPRAARRAESRSGPVA